MCDDDIGKPEADVICRMLGYPHGSQIAWLGPGSPQNLYSQHSFGHGSGRILLDDIECTGNEDSVVQCSMHRTWGDHNCEEKGAKHEWLGITCLVSILIFMLSRHISCHLEVFK